MTVVCAAVLFSVRLIGPRVAVVFVAVALLAFVIIEQPTASVLRAAPSCCHGILSSLWR
ncbi:hypothetical protein [Mycobacterium leprae]|uniref:U1937a n=1 Tax=Mycobacterium leprae TaxID=1769 RepID=Q49750_MYCLR|nr:hypothetical protein [Mycobacterium leprae]AAA17154.1 u1937a [Mycobacterium leprae]